MELTNGTRTGGPAQQLAYKISLTIRLPFGGADSHCSRKNYSSFHHKRNLRSLEKQSRSTQELQPHAEHEESQEDRTAKRHTDQIGAARGSGCFT